MHKFIPLTLLRAVVVLFGLQAGLAHSSSYYVSQDGADGNSGLSWEQAWQTLEHAGRVAQAGDSVVVRKGAKPYQYLSVKHSGSEERPIVFRGEDKDNLPVITGGMKVVDWKPSHIKGVWRIETNAKPILLMEDGRPLRPANSRACANGDWFWEMGELLYRPTTGEPHDHDVWRAARGGGIQLGDNSWIIVEDFECWLGQGACVGIDKGSNNVIKGIHAQWYARGIQIRGGHHNLIEGGVFEYNREGVYLLANASNNIVRNCKAMHNGNWPPWDKGDRSGIAIGEVGVNVGNSILDNEVAFNGGSHSDPGLIAFWAPETMLEGNDVHDNYYGGIVIGILSPRSSAIGNKVYANGREAVTAGEGNVSGLSVRRSGGVIVRGNEILNNYVSHSDPGRYVDRAAGGLDLKGNKEDDMRGIQLIDNIVCGTQYGPDLHLSKVPDTAGLSLREYGQTTCGSKTTK